MFYVDSFGRPPTETKGNLFDGLVDAAGGKPLPGKWGLAQAVLAAVTQPRHNTPPVLHWPKVALNVAGIARAYKRANDPSATDERKDPFDAYFEKKGMTIPARLGTLGTMILAYSSAVPHEDSTFGDGQDEWLRTYRLPGGRTYAFRMWKSNSYYGGNEVGSGPYVVTAEHDLFLAEIAGVVWAANGNVDLELTARKNGYGATAFSLGRIGEPGAFIGNGEALAVDASVARCRAFRARGMSRNLLFYGPPGTGKTTLARTIAREVGDGRCLRVEATALDVAGSASIVDFLHVLRPRVVLFDDMDRCMDSIVALLHMLEQGGAMQEFGAMIVGTINVVSAVDPALLRPGRFDEVIEIAEPGAVHREKIVAHYLAAFGLPAGLGEELTAATDGFAPADVREVVQSLSVVGVEHMAAEVARVQRQRVLYASDACEKYMARRAALDPVASVKPR